MMEIEIIIIKNLIKAIIKTNIGELIPNNMILLTLKKRNKFNKIRTAQSLTNKTCDQQYCNTFPLCVKWLFSQHKQSKWIQRQ